MALDVRRLGCLPFGLYTILLVPIVYGKYCNTGWSGGNTILRNGVGDVGGRVGCTHEGGVFANNSIDSFTKTSNKTNFL